MFVNWMLFLVHVLGDVFFVWCVRLTSPLGSRSNFSMSPPTPPCPAQRLVVVAVVLILTHLYNNAVRSHRTGSNNSGAEDYAPQEEKQIKNRR